MQIAFSKSAFRSLSRMAANTAKLIRFKVGQYASDPAALANNVTALQGEPGVFRLRVADWRILFTKDGEVLSIIKIAPRGDAYD